MDKEKFNKCRYCCYFDEGSLWCPDADGNCWIAESCTTYNNWCNEYEYDKEKHPLYKILHGISTKIGR